MDTTQLLLSTSVTITTILLIIVSIQLISLLKHLKKENIRERIHGIKDQNNVPVIEKRDRIVRKKVNITSLLDKMRNHISRGHSIKKTFFKSS